MENNFLNSFNLLNWLTEGRFLYKVKPKKAAPQEVKKDDEPKPGDKEKTQEEKAKEAEEKAKIDAEKKAKAGTVEDLSTMKRDDLKETLPKPSKPVECPKVPTLKPEIFAERADDTSENGEKNKLDLLKINPLRENTHIDAKQWDVTNLDGLNKVYKDCVDLGIVAQSQDFYDTLFATLRNGVDPKTNATNFKMCQDPANHKDELAAIPAEAAMPAEGKFWGGENFVKAWEHFEWLRGEIMVAKDCQELEILSKQESLDSDPVATKVADFGRSTLSSVQKAVTEGDYATLGMYAVGAYAFYKVYQRLFGGGHGAEGGEHGKDFDWKKWLLYGTAAYAGYHFAKKAGYDPLKALGLKDMDYEIKGTPMENMRTILRSCPGLKEDDKKIDADIVLRVATVNLATLHELRKQANSNGIHHIDPREFPDIFPDLADVPPFKMGRGEEEGDYTGMSTTKLSTKQREYIRVSQQLYKIAFAAEKVYDATLKKYHPEYKGIPYEEALYGDAKNPDRGDRRLAKLWHLFSATEKYAVKEPGTMFSREKLNDVRSQVVDLFKQHAEGASVDVESHVGGNHFQGKINDFPVVFVVDKDKVKVYLRNNYGKGYQRIPGGGASAEIPMEGGNPKDEVGKAVTAVEKRMSELTSRIKYSGGKLLSDEMYLEGGKWKCKVNFAGMQEFGVAGSEGVADIVPLPDGLGVSLYASNGKLIELKNEQIDYQPVETDIIQRLTAQPEFESLQVFDHANRLHIIDFDKVNKNFTLVVGKAQLKTRIKYTPAVAKTDTTSEIPAKFEVTTGALDEKGLIQSPAFANEYIEILGDDSQYDLNKTTEELKALLEHSCPQDFLVFFFKTLAGQTMRGELSGYNSDILSGSIPHNFTNMLLDTTKQQALYKLRRKILNAKNLSEVEDEKRMTLVPLNDSFRDIYNEISKKNRSLVSKEEDWERTPFMLSVTDRIRSSACVSSNYALVRSDMEALAYKMNLPGVLTMSEWNEKSHVAAGKLLDVFTYYTAHLDIAELDSLTWPPTAVDGHYILRYLEYVKDRVANEAPKITSGAALEPHLIPLPSDTRWNIMEFDVWKKSREGDFRALEAEDNRDPFEHNSNDHLSGKHTALDEELKRKLNAAKDRMIIHCEDINATALENYLTGISNDPLEMGLFIIYKKPGAPMKVGPITFPTPGKPHSRLWELYTDNIAKVAGTRKSVQIRLMDEAVQEFTDYVFTAIDPTTGNPKFFNESPGVWNKVKRWYYEFKYGI